MENLQRMIRRLSRPRQRYRLILSKLFRNVPILTSLELSPFLLICFCPWGVRRSEALRRGLCGAFRA
jgi:hypothetical protein